MSLHIYYLYVITYLLHICQRDMCILHICQVRIFLYICVYMFICMYICICRYVYKYMYGYICATYQRTRIYV